MGYYIGVVLLAIAVVLQSSVLHTLYVTVPFVDVQISGQPGLMLMLVLAWSVHATWEEAFFWAFCGGLMQDLLAITPLGTSIIPLLLVIFVIRSLADSIDFITPVLLPVFAGVATGLQYAIIIVVLTLLENYPVNPLRIAEQFILPAAVYNVVFIWPVYIILRRVQKRLPEPQSGY
jgi:rod shape-determining protein MreD